jgi:hypothetical protein
MVLMSSSVQHQAPFHLALNDSIGDTHRQKVAVDVLQLFVKRDCGDNDPFFPSFDSLDHLVTDQPSEDLIVLLKYQVIQPRTKLRIHQALTRPCAEYLKDTFPDMVMFP